MTREQEFIKRLQDWSQYFIKVPVSADKPHGIAYIGDEYAHSIVPFNLDTVRADCGHYTHTKKNRCNALNYSYCGANEKCPFYKSREQLAEDREKYPWREGEVEIVRKNEKRREQRRCSTLG